MESERRVVPSGRVRVDEDVERRLLAVEHSPERSEEEIAYFLWRRQEIFMIGRCLKSGRVQ